ncbi:MAG: sigma-54-dependent Fis family transcriptional regulator [Deltaproteobacteria bacterium]|nr:sigma-54-dependent Fis family transcriptional regulator [Deltaproteobacteria bacterium]
MYSILVVDDEESLRKQVVSLLTAKGYHVDEACDGMEAAQKISQTSYALVLCDIRMPRLTGLELLKHIRDHEYAITVALITAHANVKDAVEAMRDGAFDYIEKPINELVLLDVVAKAKQAHDLIHRLSLSAPMLNPGEGRECIGQSREMKRIFQLVEKLTRVNTSVLIRGENGTGKELVAKAIHFNSPRKEGPFVAVNCAAIPENLIESELFGHEKGAFTGADQRHIGKFQYAAKGTLFLDEIGDTSPATQVKLLRVLQDHTFTPVGSAREVKSDVRIIAATNRDLEKMIREGKFREDLYYRLNVMPIFLPPLRERKDDITGLVNHFIDKFNQLHGSHIESIAPEALTALESFRWPGNIRELENAIEHGFVVETSPVLTLASLPLEIRKASRKSISLNLKNTLQLTGLDWETGKESFEKEFIFQALKKNSGRINLTAEISNIPKNTLLRKIKKYNINPREFGGAEGNIES